MKYKVSLLPESRKKQINARKSIKKITSVSLVVLAVIGAFCLVVLGTNIFANKQLEKAQQLDAECVAEIEKLSSYRDIHAALQQKVNLFGKIQVNEPQLYQFIVDWSNVNHPGVSVTSIQCSNWKTDRLCTITGTCNSRTEYLAYEEELKKIEGVTSVSCVGYTTNVGGAEDDLASFTISVSVSGGAVVPETTTEVATTAAAQ